MSDSKRSSGVASVWVARNRFAVLDKTHQIIIRDLSNKDSRKVEYNSPVDDIFYAGTGLLLLRSSDGLQMYDIQQKRVLASVKVNKVISHFCKNLPNFHISGQIRFVVKEHGICSIDQQAHIDID